MRPETVLTFKEGKTQNFKKGSNFLIKNCFPFFVNDNS